LLGGITGADERIFFRSSSSWLLFVCTPEEVLYHRILPFLSLRRTIEPRECTV
jgi:hypothetical protein